MVVIAIAWQLSQPTCWGGGGGGGKCGVFFLKKKLLCEPYSFCVLLFQYHIIHRHFTLWKFLP